MKQLLNYLKQPAKMNRAEMAFFHFAIFLSFVASTGGN